MEQLQFYLAQKAFHVFKLRFVIHIFLRANFTEIKDSVTGCNSIASPTCEGGVREFLACAQSTN